MLIREQGKSITGLAELIREDGLLSYDIVNEVIALMTSLISSVSTINVNEENVTV